MNIFIFIIFFTFINFSLFAQDITEIKLHNQTIDQILQESLANNINSEEVDLDTLEVIEQSAEEDPSINETLLSPDETKQETLINGVFELPSFLENTSSDDIVFLLQYISNIQSPILKEELNSLLSIGSSTPKNFEKENFEKLIIDSLLKLDNRKKAYEIINTLKDVKNINNNSFYKEFILNYLFATYKLSEACEYRTQIKDLNLVSDNNYYLKVDIFCLILEEKFDEANLLNSLLIENDLNKDLYFQYLFNILQSNESEKENINTTLKNNNIYLYSAMHRIGSIPLSKDFLEIDPINLSMPIILSSATDIKLRLKAAHLAYLNNYLNVESLAALYQVADFSFDELNEPSEILKLDDDIEIGMAYFYQLINIQILPITRLEAIFKFWEFAEKHNLELIAYKLSLKSLDTINPSNELSSYGPKISKAYIYNKNFEMAEKWLIFSENSITEDALVYELNSSRLLFSLFSEEDSSGTLNILYDNIEYITNNFVNKDHPLYSIKNEILYSIFSVLNKNIENPFVVDKKLNDIRPMPSAYIINKIRNSIENKNDSELLLLIIASLHNKNWNEIHPEHFRLILMGLAQYKDGVILDDILLEILKQTKLI